MQCVDWYLWCDAQIPLSIVYRYAVTIVEVTLVIHQLSFLN